MKQNSAVISEFLENSAAEAEILSRILVSKQG